jgi:hypothetical protein
MFSSLREPFMDKQGGWVFSINDGGHPRRFLVAEPLLFLAKAVVLQQVPGADFVRSQQMPERLFTGAEMKRGDIEEWPPEAEIISLKTPL